MIRAGSVSSDSGIESAMNKVVEFINEGGHRLISHSVVTYHVPQGWDTEIGYCINFFYRESV